MNVLVVCDDDWHPASTSRSGLAPLDKEGFAFDFIEDAGDWSAARMDEYPVVLFTKSNDVSSSDTTEWMTDEVQEAFVNYVRKGGGLLVVHSGTTGYRETPVVRALLGGVFVDHPKQCPVTVKFIAESPIVEGSDEFTLQDEHYHMEFDDPDAELFMTSVSEHGTQPAGWTRTEGDGRICVLTPGHNVEVWLHPSFQTMLKNSLQWCANSTERV